MDRIITETPSMKGISSTDFSDFTPQTSSVDSSGVNWNTVIKYGLIVVILALLGFNLFTFLGNVVADTGKSVGKVAKQTAELTVEGTKGHAEITAGAVTSGVNLLEKGLELNPEAPAEEAQEIPEPDDAGNVTQSMGSKSGFCYIGEDRGFRSCVKVGKMDQCMSGDIFPTEAICINPNLRE